MMIWLNGQWVPEAEAKVSLFDRGFLYGDGLFETLLVWGGRLYRWQEHWQRFSQGLARLRLDLPWREDQLREQALALVTRRQCREGVLRLTVSRGVGRRGYSPRGAGSPTVALSLHSMGEEPGTVPLRWRLHSVPWRTQHDDPLATLKSSNQLIHVLARLEAEEAGADEAVLTNDEGHVTEASSGNLFVWMEDTLLTPPVRDGLLPGVTRGVIMQLARGKGWRMEERSIRLEDVRRAAGVWITFTTAGLVEAVALDEQPLGLCSRVQELYQAYWNDVRCANEGF